MAASVLDAAAVTRYGSKTFLAIGVSIFFINGKPTLINEPRILFLIYNFFSNSF